MNKIEKKLLKLLDKADACQTHKEATKILHKVEKARAKLAVKRMLSSD